MPGCAERLRIWVRRFDDVRGSVKIMLLRGVGLDEDMIEQCGCDTLYATRRELWSLIVLFESERRILLVMS